MDPLVDLAGFGGGRPGAEEEAEAESREAWREVGDQNGQKGQ